MAWPVRLPPFDTKDNCARFYDGRDCTGASVEILPRSPSHNNLHGWGFNDKAISVGPCHDSCSVEKIGEVTQSPIELTIFDRKNFKGAYADVKVQGCTLIPTKFVRRLLSVKAEGRCIQFYNNINCSPTGPGVDSIELRPGTPSHEDITQWHFPEAKAVSHCIFKCNTTLFSNKSADSTPGPLKNGDIVLYDEKDFKGNWIIMNIQRCTNLTDEWEGAAVSATVYNEGCVTLFDRRGCTGESLNVISPRPDLHVRNFDALTRSMQPCSQVSVDDKSLGDDGVVDSSKKRTGSQIQTTSSLSPVIIAVIVVVPLLGVILSVSLVLFIMRKCNPYGKIIEMLSEKEIQDFLKGLGLDMGNANIEDGDYSVELLAQNKPYNEAYEISRSNIKFDSKIPLGEGEFGVVYKGSVMRQNEAENGVSTIESIPVAVKTVKPNSNITCLRSLLKEVKVMIYAGMHPRIVQMIGCCTENIRKGEILLLMEFCPRGSLEDFLQKNRVPFRNIVRKGRIVENAEQTAYSNYQQSPYPISNENKLNYQNWDQGIANFDIFQLLRWCIQIAEGMEFLESRKVIHSDLATRNVLLDEKFEAKISDFGLSKQLYCYTQYVKKRQALPWRYLSIESIKNMEFSSQSDVWGYAVLCWEIFTLGEKPYPGVVWSDQFIRNLEEGMRLPKPKYTVTECYNIMLRCWEEDPAMRPTFIEILGELNDLMTSLLTISRNQANPV
ncbi:Vascular endothelial growth factor receptor 3 [Orchesella cincta]|uniref:Vascular endothelial growth factor receptor 3 n=1 Tax=Orchesella cincta TaxID=48709 RepID=A0A1D2N599_ORCCI|nr:Vascular endothelial growth factor receptor 3 [Orchesella cincta]